MPDADIWSHLEAAAAIASCLPRPAHLIFTITPCQEFIAAARRTQDLWMGSYILSYLCWRAMEPIVEELGPDNVLFPTLKGQPLVDKLLLEPQHLLRTNVAGIGRLDIPTFPNRFVALVPADTAQCWGERAASKALEAWREISEKVRESLLRWSGDKETAFVSWYRQIEHAFQFNWVALTWPDPSSLKTPPDPDARGYAWAKDALDLHVNALGYSAMAQEMDGFHRAFRFFEKDATTGNKPKRRRSQTQIGTCYSRLYGLAERALGARKASRVFAGAREDGELCTVCNMRAAVAPGGDRKDAIAFWEAVSEHLIEKKRHREVKPRGRERLCAVCATKRFGQREFFAPTEGARGPLNVPAMQRNFPSTSTIAAADFQESLVDEALSGRICAGKLRDFVDRIRQTSVPATHANSILPRHASRLAGANGGAAKALSDLLEFDGDVLFQGFFEKASLEAEFGKGRLRIRELASPCDPKRETYPSIGDLNSAQRALLDALPETVRRPSRYYAVIALDGDEMGKWLSGEKAPTIAEIMAPEVKESEEWKQEWVPTCVTTTKRFVSPSFHKAISSALTDYALEVVPHIVEELHPAKLVYAGGDDVLLLSPLSCALQIAEELRFAFRGQGRWNPNGKATADGEWELGDNPDEKQVFMHWKGDRQLSLMGTKAGASVGIAIVHHTQPLGEGIRAARELCKRAKEDYGRDALAVRVVKRSGAPLDAGGRFVHPGSEEAAQPLRIVRVIGELVELMSGKPGYGKLSPDLPARLFAEADDLKAIFRDDETKQLGAQKAEVWRLLNRQFEPEGKNEDERKQRREQFHTFFCNELWPLVNRWRPADGLELGDEVSPYGELSQWLLVARFLATAGGGE